MNWPQPKKILVPLAQPSLTSLERQLLIENFDSSWIGSNSEMVASAETLFLRTLRFPSESQALLVSNGSVAISLALEALGIKPGDEIILPSLTYAACASTIINHGAIPVFCDVDRESWQITIMNIREKITAKTKAIMVVHLYGVANNFQEIVDFARKHNIKVIEDCSEAIGGLVDGKTIGTWGDVATFSFFPNKLITSGEGGMCVTASEEIAQTMRILRGQGMSATNRYWFVRAGYNFRITGLQASILLAQLSRFDELFELRKTSEETWAKILNSSIARPKVHSVATRAPWLFTATFLNLSSDLKYDLARSLADLGIETRPVFYPLSEMPAFSRFRIKNDINAREIAQLGMTLPTGFHVQEETYKKVAEEIEVLSNANN
jgi:perosamine synthetase